MSNHYLIIDIVLITGPAERIGLADPYRKLTLRPNFANQYTRGGIHVVRRILVAAQIRGNWRKIIDIVRIAGCDDNERYILKLAQPAYKLLLTLWKTALGGVRSHHDLLISFRRFNGLLYLFVGHIRPDAQIVCLHAVTSQGIP